MLKHLSVVCMLLTLSICATAQEYQSPAKAPMTGMAPHMKYQLLKKDAKGAEYVIVFAAGDEVLSGLTEFATKNNITSAHFTAIGDADSAKVGWYDKSKKMFKVIKMRDPCEITSLIGDITISEGKPAVHAHITLGDSNGNVHGGHLMSVTIGPTLEVFVTTTTTVLTKKKDPSTNASVIDID